MNGRDLAHPAWAELRHGGLLIAPAHLRVLFEPPTPKLGAETLEHLRRAVSRHEAQEHNADSGLLDAVLHRALGLGDPARPESGHWLRGSDVGSEWTRRSITGEAVKPRRVWHGPAGASLPVFWTREPRLGVGRGRREAARVVEWLRLRGDRLALVTNGVQWRIVHASLDHEAWAESDRERWFEEGGEGLPLQALRTLLSPATLAAAGEGKPGPLLAAIEASRRSQAELSAELGERVRQAVERLIREHGAPLSDLLANDPGVTTADVYRAATRVVMRMVVVLFAEARDLLPRAEKLYLDSYGLGELRSQLERAGASGAGARAERLGHRHSAWPRVLALFRLVHAGSGHPALKVPQYGGELFAPGEPDAPEPLARALHVFESAALTRGHLMSDLAVHEVLRLLTMSAIRVRVGRGLRTVEGPVDFADLSSEYIGILYEGLLDYELRQAKPDDPVLFLAVGDEPALPLSRLEPMEDAAIEELVKKAAKKSKPALGEEEAGEEDAEEPDAVEEDDEAQLEATEVNVGAEDEAAVAADADANAAAVTDDRREAARARVLAWARRAAVAGKLVPRPKSRKPEALRQHEQKVEAAAQGLVARDARNQPRIVLPGDWYLVRFGGTRKGSGTFYTRPQLAVPTVHRTLRPLAYDPPLGADGAPNADAPAAEWTPKTPNRILALRVCDPACGSGSFPVAALRFLTEALRASLLHHQWVVAREGRLALGPAAASRPAWLDECLRDVLTTDEDAEDLLARRLRRVVVEHCLYGVDLDPLAVELAKLALWVETLDRELPFTFLDHKIRCGNSLVGCWFDRVRDFPALAWEREGGDKSHSRGTHFEKEQWTKAIKAQRKRVQQDLASHLARVLGGQTTLPGMHAAGAAEAAHDEAFHVFERLHALPLHETAERARLFREAFRSPNAVGQLRDAMDLWCAQWFWPADQAERAPLPSQMAAPSDEARAIVKALAREMKFFHWELEFPDVFAAPGAGFDAVLGNPPWEIQKPSSKEWFSNLDPLYRAYGKQQALDHQAEIFARSHADERAWLEYSARYKAMSGFVKHAAAPFGDPAEGEALSLGRGADQIHARWRARRAKLGGYADAEHPFRHQGSADLNTYKMFLEQAHVLLKTGGRMGFIVPSGLYTDKGTGDLRKLFLERCRWEWLFGFENRDKVFDIDSRFKFGPVIIEKGGRTDAVRTAFMRRDLGDWEDAERYAIPYALAQVQRFSPRTRAILEIRHRRDLEILEKVYANGVLLGDDSENGWGIQYATEFHMTNDSDKFKPRPWWEERGYRPDVYGRWLRFDPAAVSEDRAHFLSPGWLPLEGGGYVHEGRVEDVALPLYQGVMIWHFDPCRAAFPRPGARRWRLLDWVEKRFLPKYLVGNSIVREVSPGALAGPRVAFRDIASTTNKRTMVACTITRAACGNKVPVLMPSKTTWCTPLTCLLSSFVFDWLERSRQGASSLNWYVLEDGALPVPQSVTTPVVALLGQRLGHAILGHAPEWMTSGIQPSAGVWQRYWAVTPHERLRLRSALDAIAVCLYGLEWTDLAWILRNCDHPLIDMSQEAFTRDLDQKGFWRVDQDCDPELRHTVLSLVAFHDLKQTIAAHDGDRDRGIDAFCAQNDGDGWMLPETLRLADYGLGHDARAREHQPVRERMGERFLPWQLEQSVEESWAECEWHARNILGEQGYDRLQRQIRGEKVAEVHESVLDYPGLPGGQTRLVAAGQPNLFGGEFEDIAKKRRRKRA